MSVTGIVLAGGRATRFGGPKLAADLDGQPLLARAIAAVSAIADEILVAGPALPDHTQPNEPLGDAAVPRLVADATPFAGPLSALGGALAEARYEIGVIVGGDMPLLVPRVLQVLVDRLEAQPDVDAMLLGAPDDEGAAEGTEPRRQVLPIAVRIGPARSATGEALAAGDRSLRAMLDRLTCQEVPAATWLDLDPAAATLLDVDTEADLDRIRASRKSGDLA